jgi:hypothetical protein
MSTIPKVSKLGNGILGVGKLGVGRLALPNLPIY